MARRRMNLVIDQEALQDAHKASGKKTYSETVNDSLRETGRVKKVREALKWFDENRATIFMPGYREEFWLSRGDPEMARAVREEEEEAARKAQRSKRSARVVRAPRKRS